MKNRSYKEVIDDLKKINNSEIDSEEYKKDVSLYVSELDRINKREKRVGVMTLIITLLATLFLGVFAWITDNSNSDLQENVGEKNKIINRYESIVKNAQDSDSTSTANYTYHDEKGNIITVPSLIDENTKLLEKIDEYEFKLKWIKDKYGIEVKEEGNMYYLNAERVDSALQLLNIYRDKIKYDPKRKTWAVSRTYIDTTKIKKKRNQ